MKKDTPEPLRRRYWQYVYYCPRCHNYAPRMIGAMQDCDHCLKQGHRIEITIAELAWVSQATWNPLTWGQGYWVNRKGSKIELGRVK